jgi:hypothetical protein
MSDAIHLVAGFTNSASAFTTRVPLLSSPANIQEALVLYHYGVDADLSSTPTPSDNSPYGYFTELTERIVDLETTPSGGGIATTEVPFNIIKTDNSITTLPEGYIWVDENGVVESIVESGTAVYAPNQPANPTHGQVWVDSDNAVSVLLGAQSVIEDLQDQITQVEALALLGI